MVWTEVMSYWSILGLATQSARFEQAMNAKLVEMAAMAEKAAALQASSTEHQTLAFEAEEAAFAEETEASELQKEAALLFQASERDVAIAATEQLGVEELEGKIALEEEEAAAHAAAAAVDEATFEGEMSEATADAAEAARNQAKAHGEEMGIAICEFVPGLDVACDVIGGITAVGLEGVTASQAAKASAELAAAMATKAEEENEILLAADFQSKAAEDAAAAADLQTKEAEETEIAEEERISGQEKEAEAEALLEKAGTEEDTAGEEYAQAAQQEEEATALLSDATVKGVLCCWDAIMSSAFAFLSMGYFLFRISSKIILPTLASSLRSGTLLPIEVYQSTHFGRDAAYIAHHCVLFLLVTSLYVNVFIDFEQNTMRARGGLILCFAFTGACIQTVMLHSIPSQLSRTKNFVEIALESVRFLISLSLLYIIEGLIGWVLCGPTLFDCEWLHSLNQWYWWLLFMVPYGFYLRYLDVPLVRSSCGKANEDDADEITIATETAALLPTRNSVETGSSAPAPISKTWLSMLWKDIMRMQAPFEILVLSCMLVLLSHCLSSITPLWPVSKELLLSTRPDWLIPLTDLVAVFVFLAIAIALVFHLNSKCHQKSRMNNN